MGELKGLKKADSERLLEAYNLMTGSASEGGEDQEVVQSGLRGAPAFHPLPSTRHRAGGRERAGDVHVTPQAAHFRETGIIVVRPAVARCASSYVHPGMMYTAMHADFGYPSRALCMA